MSLYSYLVIEYKNKIGKIQDDIQKAIDDIPIVKMESIPTQPNGYDCGAYALQYASVVIRKWPWLSSANHIKGQFKDYISKDSFEQEDINLLRSTYHNWIISQVQLYKNKVDSNSGDIISIGNHTCWVSSKDTHKYYQMNQAAFKNLSPVINGDIRIIYICIYYTTYTYILYNIYLYIGAYTILPEVIARLLSIFRQDSSAINHIHVPLPGNTHRVRDRSIAKVPTSISYHYNKPVIKLLYDDDTNIDNSESISKTDVPYLGNINIIYI